MMMLFENNFEMKIEAKYSTLKNKSPLIPLSRKGGMIINGTLKDFGHSQNNSLPLAVFFPQKHPEALRKKRLLLSIIMFRKYLEIHPDIYSLLRITDILDFGIVTEIR